MAVRANGRGKRARIDRAIVRPLERLPAREAGVVVSIRAAEGISAHRKLRIARSPRGPRRARLRRLCVNRCSVRTSAPTSTSGWGTASLTASLGRGCERCVGSTRFFGRAIFGPLWRFPSCRSCCEGAVRRGPRSATALLEHPNPLRTGYARTSCAPRSLPFLGRARHRARVHVRRLHQAPYRSPSRLHDPRCVESGWSSSRRLSLIHI